MRNLAAVTDNGAESYENARGRIRRGRIRRGKNQKREEKGKSYLFFLKSGNIPKKNSEHNQTRNITHDMRTNALFQ
jgi:hypothetical protein